MKSFVHMALTVLIGLVLTGCSGTNVTDFIEDQFTTYEFPPLEEPSSLYTREDPYDLDTVYITVFPLPKGRENPYDFSDVNNDIDWRDDQVLELDVLFQEGDAAGPKAGYFGFGLTDANGSIRLRGHSTRAFNQKSYRIDLKNRVGTWQGFKEINLNKHPADGTRFRNKLSFDLLSELPGIPSVRTKFLHVYIKDLSALDPAGEDFEAEFVDYGLFTHVESVDRDWLTSRELDDSGALYKAENYFFQDSNRLLVKSDPDYDKAAFERIAEINGRGDHSTFIDMNNDVNNYLIDIRKVAESNFQLDNYLTWLAVNILMDNRDTNTQNFHLYSPKNIEAYYFIPWDYDGAWDFYNQIDKRPNPVPSWRLGLSNYWSVTLHSRFFREPEHIRLLNEKIVEVYDQLKAMDINGRIDRYAELVYPFVSRSPDLEELPGTLAQHQQEVQRLKSILDLNLRRYYDSIENPMPVFLGDVQLLGDYTLFTWDRSYDFQGDRLLYTLELSRTPDFETIDIIESTRFNEFSIRSLEDGVWYWRVTVDDGKGHVQIAMDEYLDEVGKEYYGIGRFEQKPDN